MSTFIKKSFSFLLVLSILFGVLSFGEAGILTVFAESDGAENPANEEDIVYESVAFYLEGTFDYEEANKVAAEVNIVRAELGLDPLVMDAALTEAAMQRAAELSIYFSHTRPDPDSRSCFSVIPEGYGGSMGENIAAGQVNAQHVMDSWLTSSGHSRNIVNASIDSMGVGCFYQEGGTKYWVQLFANGQSPSPLDKKEKEIAKKEIIAYKKILTPVAYPYSATLLIGESQTFEFYNATNLPIPWAYSTKIIPSFYASEDESIATVDEFGEVVAISEGTTIIKLGSSEDVYGEVEITVIEKIAVTGITLNKRSLNLYSGDVETLLASLEPAGAEDAGLIWSSSDESVATVSADGKITAKSNGYAEITVTTSDGLFSALCYVLVEADTSGGLEYPEFPKSEESKITVRPDSGIRLIDDKHMGWVLLSDTEKTTSDLLDSLTILEGFLIVSNKEGYIMDASTLVGSGSTVDLIQEDEIVKTYTLIIKGDADGDGKISTADARLALRLSAQLERDYIAWFKLSCDTDGDGKTTAGDARRILRVAAKLDSF